MDWIESKERILKYTKKYRYMLLILLIGIFCMTLPDSQAAEDQPLNVEQKKELSLQEALSEILSQLYGAGKVEVLLTHIQGEQTIYQTDESRSDENLRLETVIVNNSDREEIGLIRQVNPPVYQGAIVLCQGADNATIRLSIVEAVMSATGLTSDHITVLKMK